VGNPASGQFGPFLIDVEERMLRHDGEPVPLTPKAFDLLVALLEKPGQLISKEELLQKVWPDTFVEESNLAYNIFALRKALGDTAENSRYIETVQKKGYRFKARINPIRAPREAQPVADFASDGAGRPPFSVERDSDTTVVQFRKGPARSGQTALERKADVPDPDVEILPSPEPASPRHDASLRPWLWVAVAAVLAVAALFAIRSWSPSPAPTPPRAVPLTALPGVVRSPSLSPDGTFVVFSWNGPQRNNPDLYIQQIGVTAPPHRLTTDPANDFSASWSPDGRTIAFLRRGAMESKSELWRIAPLGGPERKVADIQARLASFRPASIAWCPDSTCLVVTDSLGAAQPDALFRIALESGERQQLTFPQGQVRDADPAFSPDGRWLVFRRDSTPLSGEFYRMALKDGNDIGGEPVRLTSTLYAGKPAWIPDSRDIVFGARGGLWRMDAVSGGPPSRLPFIGLDGNAPVVAQGPGGARRLVYARSFADTNVWRIDIARPGAPADAPPVTAIASTRSDMTPSLTPDGSRVVFLSDRSGDTEFWVADPDGSNAFQLTSLAILPGYPTWSPDRTLIAFHGDPNGRPDVMVVPARGGQPRTITKDIPRGAAYPRFSRDGRWIYFASEVAGAESRIWKMPAAGGAPVLVTNQAGSIGIESYDGEMFYVDTTSGPGTLWRLPQGGGPAMKVIEGVVLGNFDVVEGGVYYIDRVSGEPGSFTDRPDGETRLRYFDFATSQSVTVATNLGAIGLGLSATRDGRTVFFSRVDSSADELILVDNFR
jgi:Tol biopolymer transport system component/DNA-binding winged helix-turn-helix (wHTH) protein